MAKVVHPILATVEFVTAVKEGQYGPYQSVLFIDDAGEKIWKSFEPNSEELALLTKGTRVQLIPAGERNGKASHNIVLLDAPPVLGWSPERKRAIAIKLEEHSDLMRFCLQTAQRKFGDLVEPSDIRALATTIFIQSIK